MSQIKVNEIKDLAGNSLIKKGEVEKVVDNLVDLLTVPTDAVKSVRVLNYHSDVEGGGGVFYWDATKAKSEHNGGTVIDPTVVYPTDWDNQTQLGTWFDTSNAGVGCWVRQYDGAVNVKWFGASSVESPFSNKKAIQQALLNYKDVLVEGDYLLDTTEGLSGAIDVPLEGSKVTFTGIITPTFMEDLNPNPPCIFKVTADNVLFENGTLEYLGERFGANVGNHSNIPRLLDVSGDFFTLQNFTVNGSPKTSITFTNSLDSSVKNCTFRGTLLENEPDGETINFAIRLLNSHGFQFIGNNCYGQTLEGTVRRFSSLVFAENCNNCIISNNTIRFGVWSKLSYWYGSSNLVSDNIIVDAIKTAPIRFHGFNNKAEGNTISNSIGGIQVFGSCEIINNKILGLVGVGAAGITVTSSSIHGASFTVIEGNTVTDDNSGNLQHAISLYSGSSSFEGSGTSITNFKISNNYCVSSNLSNNGTIRVRASSPLTISDGAIVNNIVKGGFNGIELLRLNRVKIAGNVVNDVASWGLTNNDSANSTFENNTVRNAVNIGIAALGTTSITQGNTWNDAYGLHGKITIPQGSSTAFIVHGGLAPHASYYYSCANLPASQMERLAGMRVYPNGQNLVLQNETGGGVAGDSEFYWKVEQ